MGEKFQGHIVGSFPRFHGAEYFFQFMEGWGDRHPIPSSELEMFCRRSSSVLVWSLKRLWKYFFFRMDSGSLRMVTSLIWPVTVDLIEPKFTLWMHRNDTYPISLHIVGFLLPLPATRLF